jgi:hypothetical protein
VVNEFDDAWAGLTATAAEWPTTALGPAMQLSAPTWSILGWHLHLGTCVERTEERKRVFGD